MAEGREGADGGGPGTLIKEVSTRSVDDVAQAMAMAGISRSQVSRLCGEIDDKIRSFLDRSLDGDWPYLWLDATYAKVRQAGRIVSVAVSVAVAVNDQGRREVVGMAIGASGAGTFWIGFLRSLSRRGPRGVKLVIADDHKGLKAAATRTLGATSQRCRVHCMRNQLAHAGKQGRLRRHRLRQGDAEAVTAHWRLVADQLRPKVPELAALVDEAGHDILACMSFPGEHGARRCIPQTPSNGSMPRSGAAPTSSASSPTKTPSPAWSAPSWSNRTATGQSRARDT